MTTVFQTQLGWSKYNCVAQLLAPGACDSNPGSHFLNGSVNAHTRDNHFGAIYTLNYDITHSAFTQQQVTGFYNAQCCGLAFQYMTTGSFGPYPPDRRFFLSFTLAGLGNFSPFNGALGGVPR